MIPNFIGTALLIPLLLLTVLIDFRHLRIPHWLLLLFLCVFAIFFAPFMSIDSLTDRFTAAAVIFVIGFVLYMLGSVGAGDVKAITVFSLFLHPLELPAYLILVAVGGVVGLVLVRAVRRLSLHQRDLAVAQWMVWNDQGKFPYGFPLACGLLLIIFSRFIR